MVALRYNGGGALRVRSVGHSRGAALAGKRAVAPVAPPSWRGQESHGLAAACPRDPHSQMAMCSRRTHGHESGHGLHEEVLELSHSVAERGGVEAGDGRECYWMSCTSHE